MASDPEQEILVSPGWSIIVDGLGYSVLSLGGVPSIDKDGRRIVRFKIKPAEVIRKRYNLRPGAELDKNGNMTLIVLESDLIAMNQYDDANRRWLYVKTLKGDETAVSLREKDLRIQIDERDKTIRTLQAENIFLAEQLELAKTQPAKFIAQYAEVYKEASAAIASSVVKNNQENQR